MPETIKHKFNENIENVIGKIVVDQEWEQSKDPVRTADFESVVDSFEGMRAEREYQWMSDVSLGTLTAMILTDMSTVASQYFQTRDFVEVKLDGDGPTDDRKCRAAKKVINKTLNRKELYYFQKFMRGNTINSLSGQVYALCWWEKELRSVIQRYEDQHEQLDVDTYGNPITDPETQTPATRIVRKPIWGEEIVNDHFNFEIVDSRNVRTDKKYCYSIQEKDWITFRSEKSYPDLLADKERKGYFNLDLIKELSKPEETDTAKETFNKGEKPPEKPVVAYFDVLLRLGKIWVKLNDKGKYEPGYNDSGEPLEDAELRETIIEEVVSGSSRILIRFQENEYRDVRGRQYKPVVRGLCYIHPTKDDGLSDGKYIKDIHKAIDDNFNMGADRVKLATMPVFQGNKYMIGEDNPTIFIEPGHVMETESGEGEVLKEFKISDNIDGMLRTDQMLRGAGQQLLSIYPTTMGDLPAEASTTATAIAGAETRSNTRGNYKRLTVEYTFLVEFYGIILQMFYQFAELATAEKILGDDAEFFDPDQDYTYSPVSSSIEQEYSKRAKIQLIDQIIGRLVAYPNPKTSTLINKLLAKVFEYLGDEFPQYNKFLLDENVNPPMDTGAGGATGGNMPTTAIAPASNQNGIAQSPIEMMQRNAMGGGMSGSV
jgi:hypothetical protein